MVNECGVRKTMTEWEHGGDIVLVIPSVSEVHLLSVVTIVVNAWVLNLGHFFFIVLVWHCDW